MTVVRRQWNSQNLSDTQAASMLLNSAAGGNWVRARKHAAHLVESSLCARCGRADETEAHRLWECEHNSSFDLPPMLPAPSLYGNAETCPALWIRGLVPGQYLHYFPAPEYTPLFVCNEAATSDIITPRQGEHMLVGFGDASGGRYATDTRYRRVVQLQSSRISQVPSGPTSRIFPSSSYSIQQGPRSLAPRRTRRALPPSPCRCAYMRPFPCAQAGCRCCRGRRKRRREASSGLSSSFSPTHVAPFYILPTTWGWSQGFTQTAISFRPGLMEKLWNRIGQLVTNRGSRVEVRHVGSHATADDVVEGRAQLPQVLGNNMADTLARMSADSLECDEAQVLLNTHLEQLATVIRKRGTSG